MEEFKELDQIFRKGLENAKVNPPAGVWESISASVSTGAAITAKATIWVVAAKWVAGALVAGGIAYGGMLALQNDEPETPAKPEKVVVTNPAQESPVQNQRPEGTDMNAGKESATNNATNIRELMDPEQTPGDDIAADDGLSIAGQDGWVVYPPLSALGKEPKNDNHGVPAMSKNPETGAEARNATDCKSQMAITAQEISKGKYQFSASPGGENMIWHFDDGTAAMGSIVIHQYSKLPGVYYARVNGVIKSCRYSAVYQVIIRGDKPVLPDVFTPNSYGHAENDSLNDVYVVDMKNTTYFDLVVRDLQGRQLFRSDNPAVKWNGKCANIECPEGTYQVTLAYKYPGDEKATVLVQRVLLIREKR